MQLPLCFLRKLQHVELPHRVDRPQEIKFVSVLSATGLVEAQIGAAFAPTGTFVPAEVASVTCITDAGWAELHNCLTQSN